MKVDGHTEGHQQNQGAGYQQAEGNEVTRPALVGLWMGERALFLLRLWKSLLGWGSCRKDINHSQLRPSSKDHNGAPNHRTEVEATVLWFHIHDTEKGPA